MDYYLLDVLLIRLQRPTLFRLSILRQFLPTLQQIGTPALQRWVVDRIPIERVQRLKEIVDVMHNTSKMVLEQKKRALGIWNTEGKVKGIKVGVNPQGAEKTDMEFARTLVGEGKDMMSILCMSPRLGLHTLY